MAALEQLLSRWRSNPDAETTLAVCGELSLGGVADELVREVGARAEQWHAHDLEVLVAVGRMYLRAGLLSEAQAAFVGAGKANPQDPRAFRLLGEVLLRRGDAIRAEKVLERAMQLGGTDASASALHAWAARLRDVQQREGGRAAAAAFERAAVAISTPGGGGTGSRRDGGGLESYADISGVESYADISEVLDDPLGPGAAAGQRPLSFEEISKVESFEEISGAPAFDPEAPTRRTGPPPGKPGVAPPARRPPPKAPASASAPRPHAPPPRGAEPSEDEVTIRVDPNAARRALLEAGVPQAWSLPSAPPATPSPPPLDVPASVAVAAITASSGGSFFPSDSVASPLGSSSPAKLFDAPTYRPPADGERAGEASGPIAPDLVLSHLAQVGVYEPGGGAPPAWMQPKPSPQRGWWVMALASALLLGAGGGAYLYAENVKEQRLELAARTADEVEALLASGTPAELAASDEKLSLVFDLDSLSPRAARLWLHNRVLRSLLSNEEVRGVDAAVLRARDLGVEEHELASGRLITFMAEDDLAGALALIAKWDRKAAKDPLFQLAAGAVLERAGDARARERYEKARLLAPRSLPAKLLAARLALLESGADAGRDLVEELGRSHAERVDVRALRGLMWVVDRAPSAPPAGVLLTPEERRGLPLPLTAVPDAIDAVAALAKRERRAAVEAIERGLARTSTPAMATEFGFLAIRAGHEQLARKAALRAVRYSAAYPRARLRAARVALVGGRLEEANKAIDSLQADAHELALVRAAVAYELLDGAALAGALGDLGTPDDSRHDLAALAAAGAVLGGQSTLEPEELERLSTPAVVWGELIAIDAALNEGQVELADKLTASWADAESPAYALRLARLRRYQGRLDDALQASSVAIDQGTLTPRALVERLYELLAKEDHEAAKQLVDKASSTAGALGDWMRALVEAAGGDKKGAEERLAKLELPGASAPLALRVLAVRTLALARWYIAAPSM